jgi:hypothetical protein
MLGVRDGVGAELFLSAIVEMAEREGEGEEAFKEEANKPLYSSRSIQLDVPRALRQYPAPLPCRSPTAESQLLVIS